MQSRFIRHRGCFIYNGSGGGCACVNILLILRCGSRSFLSVTGGAFYRRVVRLIHQCARIGRIHGFFCRFLSRGAACCRICRSSIGSCCLRRRRCSCCLVYSLCSRCLFCCLTGSSIRGRVVTSCITDDSIAAICVRFIHSFDIIRPRIRVGAIVIRSGIIASITIV